MAWVDIEDIVRRDPPNKEEALEVFDYLKRKAKPRFYADENFPPRAIQALKKMGANVLTVADSGLAGHSDEDHAAYALKNGYILVTCDRDYLNERRFPLNQSPALFVFDIASGTEREIRNSFSCLGSVFSTPQFYDKWVKVDAKQDTWTENMRHLDGTTSRSRYRLNRGYLQEWLED
jgi:predicted nuclease of predicted toxin-antitoxin system